MKRLVSSTVVIIMMFSLMGCKDSKQQEVVIEDTISMNEHNQLMEDLKAEYESEPKDIRLPELMNESSLVGEFHYNGNDQFNQETIKTLSEVIDGDTIVRLIKETETDLLISVFSFGNAKNAILLVDKETYEIKKRLTFETSKTSANSFKKTEVGILVKSNNDVQFYDDDLVLLKTIELPEVISEAIIIGSELGLLGMYDIGYDISSDMSKYVFWDEAGLKSFDGSTKNVVESFKIEGPDGSMGGYLVSPTFLGKNDNVMAMISGYEGFSGFIYYDRTQDDVKVYHGGSDRNFTMLYNGTKLINISPFYSDGYGDGWLMSVDDGSFMQMDRDNIDNDGNIIENKLYYDRDDQILSIDHNNIGSQLIIRDKDLNILHRASLKSDDEYARFSLIGALKDGNVLLIEEAESQSVIKITW